MPYETTFTTSTLFYKWGFNKNIMWLIIGGLVVVIGIVLFIVLFYNSVVRMKMDIEDTQRQIESKMKKRFELIAQLVSMIRPSMKSKRGILVKATRLKNMPLKTKNDINRADDIAKELVKSIISTIENNPQLRENETVKELIRCIKDTETEIAQLRYHYNTQLKRLNTKLITFPNNLIADALGLSNKLISFRNDYGESSQSGSGREWVNE